MRDSGTPWTEFFEADMKGDAGTDGKVRKVSGDAASGPWAVEARGLTKRYGDLTAVNEISFTVGQGEAFGLLGPNGAGKSTTMRMIYCRTPLTSGTLMIQGMDVTTAARGIRSVTGVVPQENNLDPDLDVLTNLLVYARYFRLPNAEAAARAEQLLQFTGLEEKRHARIESLSGGMKRRLMIARGLINNPSILVLDEPTTGLDPHVRFSIWEKLRELRARGMTIVLSTHYMDEAEKLCDRMVIIDHGKILVSGPPRNLIRRYARTVTLEAHNCQGKPLLVQNVIDGQRTLTGNEPVLAEDRGSTHFYFADNAELLAPLLSAYQGHETFLRPSNLEDVFLRLTGTGRLE
ncbi:MAG: ABC transporter ATP-binding protein [Blastocatellia bacterium]